jgi:ABC-2 type transport system permease protein
VEEAIRAEGLVKTFGKTGEQLFVTTANDPAYTALLGPAFSASLGSLATQRAGYIFLFVGLAAALTLIRHTRADEESGRMELVRTEIQCSKEGAITPAPFIRISHT